MKPYVEMIYAIFTAYNGKDIWKERFFQHFNGSIDKSLFFKRWWNYAVSNAKKRHAVLGRFHIRSCYHYATIALLCITKVAIVHVERYPSSVPFLQRQFYLCCVYFIYLFENNLTYLWFVFTWIRLINEITNEDVPNKSWAK